MRAALAALFLMATPASAQHLRDAEPDCRYGRRLYAQCEPRCKAEMVRDFRRGGKSMEDLNRALNECLDRCWGLGAALEECHETRNRKR